VQIPGRKIHAHTTGISFLFFDDPSPLHCITRNSGTMETKAQPQHCKVRRPPSKPMHFDAQILG
jgi:hypothetical protein